MKSIKAAPLTALALALAATAFAQTSPGTPSSPEGTTTDPSMSQPGSTTDERPYEQPSTTSQDPSVAPGRTETGTERRRRLRDRQNRGRTGSQPGAPSNTTGEDPQIPTDMPSPDQVPGPMDAAPNRSDSGTGTVR